jgi:hypothetical protein
MYKDNILINDKYKYGVEIEFSGAGLIKVYSNLITNFIPCEYVLNHHNLNLNFDKWYVDTDMTVTSSNNFLLMGGEVSSKILSDCSEDWLELKKVCDIIKESSGIINDRCSTHINIDISKYLDNPMFFEILTKVVAIYEIDMNIFYMGDSFYKRATKEDYARSMCFDITKRLKKFNFKRDDLLDCLVFEKDIFGNRDGINLVKAKKSGIIEFRYPNGTLNPEIIQNYINFTIKLIDAIGNNKFDLDYLNYLFKGQVDDPIFLLRYLKGIDNIDKFCELINIISYNRNDIDSFYNQYMKVISSRNKRS